MKRLLFIICFLMFATPLWGATDYYIAAAGSGEACTSGSPCALATAVAAATSGDTIFFKSDDTWGGTSLPILTATAGVTYDGSTYGGGTRATIKPTSGSGYGAVNIFVGNVTFKGFNIDLNGLYAGGINIGMESNADISNIIVNDCLVHDSALTESTPHYYYGIYIGAYGVHTTSNVQILNSKVYRMGHEGISVYPSWMQKPSLNHASNILIRGNEVYDVGNAGDYRGNAIDFGLDSDNVTVEFNYVHDFHENGIVAVSGGGEYGGLGEPNSAIVRYNIIKGAPYNKTGVAISAQDGGDGAFYGNIFIDADFFIGGYDMKSAVWKIYNNTMYHSASSSQPALYLNSPTNATGVEFINNLIYYAGNDNPIEDGNGALGTHSYNLIYRASGTLVHVGTTSYTAANVATWEATAVTGNPAFIANTLPTGFTGTYGTNMVPNTDYFQLTTDSPAKDTGATLASYTGAINGAGLTTPIVRPLGAAFDIGAYEYGTVAQSGGSAGSGFKMQGASINSHGTASCSASTDYIGNKGEGTVGDYIHPVQYNQCWAYTPSCSGAVNTAYVYHRGTGENKIKVALYSKSTTAPAVTDALLAQSAEITSSTNEEWASGAMGSYSVNSATTYWICVDAQTATNGGWPAYLASGDSNRYEKNISSTTFPDNLADDYTGPTDDRIPSLYISIGE